MNETNRKKPYRISKDIIAWLTKILEYKSINELAEKYSKSAKDVPNFIDGYINIGQLEALAKNANIPFGFLFLDKPIDFIKTDNAPDLRTSPDKKPLDADFYALVEHIEKKIYWYKDYLKNISEDTDSPYVGKLNKNEHSYQDIAKVIIKDLDIDRDELKKLKQDKTLNYLIELVESKNIFVFRDSILKNNTRKTLDVRQFRGFSIPDKQAPAIFINSNDEKNAQTFTLLHELTHIWIGKGGVSDYKPSENEIEILCNKVAAEILVPEQEFNTQFQRSNGDYDALSKHFSVSKVVAYIKAHDLGYISFQEKKELIEKFYAKYFTDKLLQKNKPKENNNKIAFNQKVMVPIRNSRKLTNILVNETMAGNMLFRDAGNLLGAKPSLIPELYKKFSASNKEKG